MEELKAAVTEWRDARQAIFDNPLDPASPEMWKRLGNAEHRLRAWPKCYSPLTLAREPTLIEDTAM